MPVILHLLTLTLTLLLFQADDPKEAAKDILARAAARGIITGVNTDDKNKSNIKLNKALPTVKNKKSKDGAKITVSFRKLKFSQFD